MGLVLGARPAALLAILYKPEYGVGATALPILVAGECCLALLGVACAILNAAGRTAATLSFMAVTVAVGSGAAAILVPRATPGAPMLVAAAAATSLGMAAGFVASLVYLRVRLGGGLPPATVARVAASLAAAVVVGRFLPAHGKILGLATIAVVGVVYARGPRRARRVRRRGQGQGPPHPAPALSRGLRARTRSYRDIAVPIPDAGGGGGHEIPRRPRSVPALHRSGAMARAALKVLKACWAALAFILLVSGVIG